MTEQELQRLRAGRRLRLSDGSSWPRPALDRDEIVGVEWMLRYGTPTRQGILEAAAIVESYGYLLLSTTREKRDLVCREVRQQLAAESSL